MGGKSVGPYNNSSMHVSASDEQIGEYDHGKELEIHKTSTMHISATGVA